MLPLETVKQVEQLLRDGQHSHRQIARIAGVSRNTVNLFSTQRAQSYEQRVQAKQRQRAERSTRITPAGFPERCPTCGGKVYMPCRLCKVREKGR